jgi:hypothetical protein
MTISETRAQLVANIRRYDSRFVDSPKFELDYLQGKLDHFHPPQPVVTKVDAIDPPVSRVSVSIVSQWKSHRDNQVRHLDHDPARNKEALARFDERTIAGSREYDERFARRTAELLEVNRLDASGPGEIGEVTKKQLESIAYFDKLSKRGGSRGGSGDAA